MSFVVPPAGTTNPLRRVWNDLRAERAASAPYPPGETRFDMARTKRMRDDPLTLLLEMYERYGPVFSLRTMHDKAVWMIGPEANYYVTVSHAQNFLWRPSYFSDLIPLIGDGLLTTDGNFHRRSRRIMLPAFHHESVAAALQTMSEEIDRALEPWSDGTEVELYAWARQLTLRIAMRALFGLDPDASYARDDPAARFEEALGFYSKDYVKQMLRGPFSPWARMHRARAKIDAILFSEIARRQSSGERGQDLLSLLLDAEDEDGSKLTAQQVRDEAMTLLWAGHDTTTATIAFLLYELMRHPEEGAKLRAEIGERTPDAAELMGGGRPALDRAVDETLRLYPPAWIGPRRSVEAFEFAGHSVPGDVPVSYSSWVSHHLPDVWERPHEFVPDRWAGDLRSRLPKGAYIPFGAGSRTCIGMRFGELEVRAVVAAVMQRFELELPPGFELRIRQMPTISPRDGVPTRVRARRAVAEPVAA